MTTNDGLPAAGWHDDPEDPTQLRYWDGSAWTEHRSPKGGGAQAPVAQAPVAQAPVAQRTVSPKTGTPIWVTALIGFVALFIGMGVGFGIGALTFGGDDAKDSPKTSATKPPASTGSKADPTDNPDSPPAAAGGAGKSTDPLTIDTPWTYNTSWFGEEGTEWEGTFEGLVSIPVYEWEEDQDGRCFAIIGTMSPTSIAEGAFTSSLFDTPSFEVIVDGSVAGDLGLCETGSLEAAGYGSMWGAEVSVGTPYKFYSDIFLSSGVSGDIELIVVGSASDSGAIFYQAPGVTVG